MWSTCLLRTFVDSPHHRRLYLLRARINQSTQFNRWMAGCTKLLGLCFRTGCSPPDFGILHDIYSALVRYFHGSPSDDAHATSPNADPSQESPGGVGGTGLATAKSPGNGDEDGGLCSSPPQTGELKPDTKSNGKTLQPDSTTSVQPVAETSSNNNMGGHEQPPLVEAHSQPLDTSCNRPLPGLPSGLIVAPVVWTIM